MEKCLFSSYLSADDPELQLGPLPAVSLVHGGEEAPVRVLLPDECCRGAADLWQPHPGGRALKAAHPTAPHQAGQLGGDRAADVADLRRFIECDVFKKIFISLLPAV